MEIVGIQKEDRFVRVACLSMVNREIVIKYLETNLSFEKKPYIVSGIDGQDLLIRHLKTPLTNMRALYKTLPFQLEALIPYSVNDVIVKPIFNRKEKETQALFFTVSKENLKSHIASFQEEGIDPDFVSTHPMALFRFASFSCPDIPTLVVFHIGKTKMQLVSIRDHMISSHLTLHIGANDFQDSQAAAKLKKEVDRAFCFLAHKEEEECGIRKVLFCGEKAKEISALLKGYNGCDLTEIDIQSYRGFNADAIRPFAIPIGLAIDALKNDRISIQLRQNDFISKRSLKGLKKELVRGGLFALILFALTVVFSESYFKKREETLSLELKRLSHAYQKEIPTLKLLCGEGKFGEILSKVKKALLQEKNREKVFTPPSLVSDVLAFFSTHPKLQEMEVIEINYELKDGPKAHLVFTTLEAKKAREFHDAIVEEEVFVDHSKEIKWNRNENTYEITFFVRT